MIEQIGAAPMEVTLLGGFTFILGAFALIVWDLLRGRGRPWLRVVAVVVGAPACALAATVISAGIGWAVAATLEADEPPPPPAHTEQTTAENQQRTSSAGGRDPETTTERSASTSATATASPTPSASATATASPTPTASPS